MGGGYFVEIAAPDGLRVQYCHLQRIAPGIDYHDPIKKADNWWHPFAEEGENQLVPKGKPIDRGDLIGWVGHSGLAAQGVVETIENVGRIASWDEDHVHFWVGFRNPVTGAKINQKSYDPFWIYSGDLSRYNAALQGRSVDMWARGIDGRILYARNK